MKDATEHGAKPRYAFASDLDGDLCLIAPTGTSDWGDWRVYRMDGDGVRSAVEPNADGFAGHVHRDAEASWSLEWAAHVEVAIPGEQIIVMHPGVFQAQRCPACEYRGPRQMPQAGNYPAGGLRVLKSGGGKKAE